MYETLQLLLGTLLLSACLALRTQAPSACPGAVFQTVSGPDPAERGLQIEGYVQLQREGVVHMGDYGMSSIHTPIQLHQ